MARLLIGFAVLIVVGSMGIIGAKVYFLGEGPQGEYRALEAMPAAEGAPPAKGTIPASVVSGQ